MGSKGEKTRLKVTDDTHKMIRNSHPELKRRIRAALQTILDDPSMGKALVDDLAGLRSFRVGRTRIIYRLVWGRDIEVVTIGPRKSVYEETFKLISGSSE